MAATRSCFRPYMEANYNIDRWFYEELCRTCPYLNLHLLPIQWFHFIFFDRPFNEIWYHLHFINEALEYETHNSKVHPICPDLRHIWRWTNFCSPRDVKVVIVGQDPYPSYEGDQRTRQYSLAADGYGFSIDKEYFNKYIRPLSVDNISDSFKSIINLVYDDTFEEYLRKGDGDLTSWYRQGVLMLDLALTTRGKNAGAHAKFGWDYIVKLVIENLARPFETRKVFMFWGRSAQRALTDLVDGRRHLVLSPCHPTTRKPEKDIECSCKCWSDPEKNCFQKANNFLADLHEHGPRHTINWNPLC